MRRIALALLSLAACNDVDPGETEMVEESTGATSDATAGPVCGDGHVDPGEECDGSDHCDAWCMPAAYILALPVAAGDLSTYVSAQLRCESYADLTGKPYRKYLPYIGPVPEVDMAPLSPPQSYSQLCELGVATASKADSLAAIGELQLGDLCAATSDLSQYTGIWSDLCTTGTAKVRDENGVHDFDCHDINYKAILLCVGQPL